VEDPNMTMFRGAVLVVALALAACGEGVIPFGGGSDDEGGGDNIVVNGQIRDIIVENALRAIVVFVYTDLSPTATLPPASSDFRSVRTVVVDPNGDRTFSVKDINRGSLTVVFLQDHASDPDGEIDCDDVTVNKPAGCPPDPGSTPEDNAVAVLVGAGKLSDVRGGSTVTLEDVDVGFPTATADAEEILIARTMTTDAN
jgi:hypothetical protein